MESIDKLIYDTKQLMMLRYPRFGSEIANSKISIKSDLACHTAATDGKNIFVDPDYFASLNEEERLFVIAHELMHIKFAHMYRLEDKDGNRRNPALWNIATDAIINANLERDGFTIKEGYVNKPEALDYSAEEFYDLLLEEKKKKEEEKNNQKNNNSGGKSQQNQQGNGESQEQQENQGSGSQQSQEQPNENSSQNQSNEQKDNSQEQTNKQSEQQDSSKDDNSEQSDNQESSQEQTDKQSEQQDGSKDDNSEQSDNQEGQSSDEGEEEYTNDDHSMWEEAFEERKNGKKTKESEEKDSNSTDELSNDGDDTPDDIDFNEKDEFTENRRERREKAKENLKKLKDEVLSSSFSQKVNVGSVGYSDDTVDWRLILRREVDKTETVWSQRRSIAENNYAYRLEENDIDDNAESEVLIDVSGSVDIDLVRAFLRMIKPILKESKLKVGCFNLKYWGMVDIKTESDIDNFIIPEGARGSSAWGEDWDLAVRSFSKKREVNKIVFTDGEISRLATMPKDDLKHENVIWIVYDDEDEEFVPCCGTIIRVTSKQLQNLYDYESSYESRKGSR